MSRSEQSPLDELNAALEAIGGCSDGDCKVYVRPGMHTNGGCKCFYYDKHKAERVVYAYRRYVRAVEASWNTRAPSALPVEGWTHDDLCRLSILFGRSADFRTDQDRRINDQLRVMLSASPPEPGVK